MITDDDPPFSGRRREPAPPGGHEHYPYPAMGPDHYPYPDRRVHVDPRMVGEARQVTLPEIVSAVEHEAIAVVNAALALAQALDVKADLSTGAKTPMPPMTLGARLVQTSHDLSAAAEVLRRALAML